MGGLALLMPIKRGPNNGLHFDIEQLPLLALHIISEQALLQKLGEYQRGAEVRLQQIQVVQDQEKKVMRRDSSKGLEVSQILSHMLAAMVETGAIQWYTHLQDIHRDRGREDRPKGAYPQPDRERRRPWRSGEEPNQQVEHEEGNCAIRGRHNNLEGSSGSSTAPVRSLSAMRRELDIRKENITAPRRFETAMSKEDHSHQAARGLADEAMISPKDQSRGRR